jgi:peroxiredoxin
MKKDFNFPILLVAVILLACGSPSPKSAPVEDVPVQVKNDLPPMLVATLNGSQVNIHTLKGEVILILFHPDCDHCQREATEIRQHLEAFQKYALYFISTDQKTAIEKFAGEYDLAGKPNVFFGTTTVQNVIDNFGAIAAPSVYIYSDQQLRNNFNGEVDIQKILQVI